MAGGFALSWHLPIFAAKSGGRMKFEELDLCEEVLEGLRAMNFTDATPVQEKAIPVLLKGRDIIACAQTGTGKTAAFILPLLHNLRADGHQLPGIKAVIMAPTRELAQQIDQQMEGFSYFMPFSSVPVYGGNDSQAWDTQRRGLQKGADVVIATPGRLLQHMNLYNVDFSHVKYFILDEADRMLDMGFFDDIMQVVNHLPSERQTIMFSATMPPKIRQLAKTILKDPEEVRIAIARPPESIMQTAFICYETQKPAIIKHLFSAQSPHKVILFSGSKLKVKEITKTLRHMGFSTDEMHSDLDQARREHVMHEFRNNRVDILVATDIVARGIDIDDITLVINYDVPHEVEDYVHRIGRTARAGEEGMSITLVSQDEQYRFKSIEDFLQKDIYKIPMPIDVGEGPAYEPERYRSVRNSGKNSRSKSRGKPGRDAPRTNKNRKTGNRRTNGKTPKQV